jgi:hypothetical protein
MVHHMAPNPSAGRWNDVTVNGNVGQLVQIQDVHGDVHLLTDEIVEKLAIAIDAQRSVNLSDRRTREAVSRSLSLLRSRGVLYAGLDDENWIGVFSSLKDLRNSLAEASAELMTTGPASVSSLLQLMTTALRDYLILYEARFNSHMNYPSGNWNWHDQFTWPDLQAAGTDLVLLRRLLVAAIEPLNSYATAGEVVDWDPNSYMREFELRRLREL